MNIEDNCTDTLTELIKEKDIPSVWKVSIFIIPYFAYCNYDLVPISLHIIFYIKFIIWYGLLGMPKNYTISISYINISKQKSSIVWNYFQNKKNYKYELKKGKHSIIVWENINTIYNKMNIIYGP